MGRQTNNNQGKVKMVDVAQAAGVSLSTVSRVLNQPETVCEETRQQVLKVMKDLNYTNEPRKNTEKRTEKSLGTIAVLVPEIYTTHFQYLVTRISQLLVEKNYLMILCPFENNTDILEKYCKDLIRKKVDGCIINCFSSVNDTVWLQKLMEMVPVSATQSMIPDVDTVQTYDEQGTYEVLEQLVQNGHRKIGVLVEKTTKLLFPERLNAYMKIHEDYGIPVNPDYIVRADGYFQSSYEQACRLLSLEDRPTAIHCYCLNAAMGVYVAIRDMKLRIPEDISVTCFDDADIARLFTPPITVASQPINSMASAAVDLLLDRIEKHYSGAPRKIVFPTTLVTRESVGKPGEQQ